MPESQSPQCIDIPKNQAEWQQLATKYAANNLTVHTMEAMNSGSMVTPKQFLSFRVIWPQRKDLRHLPRTALDEMGETFKKKKSFSHSFGTYLKAVEKKKWGPSKVDGVFQLVRKYQMEVDNRIATDESTPISDSVTMSPTPMPGPATSSDGSQGSQPPAESSEQRTQTSAAESGSSTEDETPAAEQEWRTVERTTDEQYVNTALITFLDAVTVNVPEVKCHWGIGRLAFKAEFDKASMEARTDGYLYGLNTDEAFAIVETKAHLRKRKGNGSRIYMQESAEMVAWIVRDAGVDRIVPLENNRRLLVSQDRDEIYLTWASYNDDYVKYLTDPTFDSSVSRPFLTMNETGPFMTRNHKHMRRLAQYIGLVCCQVTDLIKKAGASTSQT